MGVAGIVGLTFIVIYLMTRFKPGSINKKLQINLWLGLSLLAGVVVNQNQERPGRPIRITRSGYYLPPFLKQVCGVLYALDVSSFTVMVFVAVAKMILKIQVCPTV